SVNFSQFAAPGAAVPSSRLALPRRHAVSEAEYARLKSTIGTPGGTGAPTVAPPTGPQPAPQLATTVSSFEGIDDNCCFPSDPAIASNGTQVLYAANDELAAKNLLTGLVTGPVTFSAFFSVLPLPYGTTLTDPRAVWDSAGGRFILTVDAINFATLQAWVLV